MITKPTLFVLGAGASNPYQYPLGSKLKDLIVEDLRNEQALFNYLVTQNFQKDVIGHFQYCLSTSAAKSIDAFLDTNKSNNSMIQIGKLSIAHTLSKSEVEDNLYWVSDGDWYIELFNKMLDNGGLDSFANNKVSFINFNYDRSLKHYFYRSLKSRYSVAEEGKVREVVRKIQMIHPHGNLGNLEWETDTGTTIEYGSTDVRLVAKRAESLRVASEECSDDIKRSIQDLILGTDQVVFMGFAFHPENRKRLGINWGLDSQKFLSTNINIGRREAIELRKFSHDKIVLLEDPVDCLHMLKEMVVLEG